MSSTFELYERLNQIIPKEKLDNIEYLKRSFDNILEVISNNHIINKVSSDIDIFYKTKIKNFSLYESKCLVLNELNKKTNCQLLFNKNENSNISFEVVNYINEKNNLCIFDVNKNKLIKSLPDLDDIRIIHGFEYKRFITVTIDNYLNICINFKKNDYKLSIYLYKNTYKYPLILFYNSKICYLDEKILDYNDNLNKSKNLLNQILKKLNDLLESEYSKSEIKNNFNSIEKHINDFFIFQDKLKDYKLTRSMNLNINNYNFQLEYFNDMRVLFESIKNHNFSNESFIKCKELEVKNKELSKRIKDFDKTNKFNDGKLIFLKNSLEKKEQHCNKLIEKYDYIKSYRDSLIEENNNFKQSIIKTNRNTKFNFRLLLIFILFLIFTNCLFLYLFLIEIDDTNKYLNYYEYYKIMIINSFNFILTNLELQYNNLINSKFINETIKEYL